MKSQDSISYIFHQVVMLSHDRNGSRRGYFFGKIVLRQGIDELITVPKRKI